MLYLAARYSDDLGAALIANANVGGDNCHRGAILGALLGAALGFQAIPERWQLPKGHKAMGKIRFVGQSRSV